MIPAIIICSIWTITILLISDYPKGSGKWGFVYVHELLNKIIKHK